MGLKCGIVGLPNVGKSTIFNALTSGEAASSNYPFCTIDPNIGIVDVPDSRLAALAKLVNPEKIVPAQLEFVDIAGLVKGASKGEGLGNQFLANIRNVDAIAHIVRCFDDSNIIHVHGGVDPIADVEVIDTELILADLDVVEKKLDRTRKQSKSGDKILAEEVAILEEIVGLLNKGIQLRTVKDAKFATCFRDLSLLTAKKVIYVANVDEGSVATGNAYVDKLRAALPDAHILIISGKIESELSSLSPEERIDFMASLGIAESGLSQLIREAFTLLGLITYFTAGPKEVKAWTIPVGTLAPQAAGVIHTDFEKGFIRAEVISCDEYLKAGSEANARAQGTARVEGKEYEFRDGDIAHFRFNV